MGFGPQIFFPAVVSETDLHGANIQFSDVGRPVAEALGPEVGGLVAHSWYAPIFDERLPDPSVIGGEVDLVFGLSRRWIARGDVGCRVNCTDRFVARRSQFQHDFGTIECACNDMRGG